MNDRQDGRSVDNVSALKASVTGSRPQDSEIYNNIYTAIVEHYIAPGTKLPEDALAESFNVSRTIIRKVLLSLSHDGLITSEPKRGARVAQPTVAEAREVFEARRIMEAAVIPLIADVITAKDIKKLRSLVNDEKQAWLAHDARSAIRLSGKFHKALIAVTGNKRLFEFLRNLISRSSLIIAVYGTARDGNRSCHDHNDLLDLFEAGKAGECESWMDEHLRHVEATLDFGNSKSDALDFAQVFSEIGARQTK